MGFFSKPDPMVELKKQLEKKPKDSKLLLDLAAQYKAKGRVTEAVETFMLAANALVDQGFTPKGIAIAKQAMQLAPKVVDPLEFLVREYEGMNVKEELRPVLKTLLTLYRNEGRVEDAATIQTKIEALGPGR